MAERNGPVLKGPIEMFCRLMAEGKKSQADCWFESHPGTIITRHGAAAEAWKTLKRPDVVARIKEIREPAVAKVRKKIQYELEDAFEELEKALAMATAQLNPVAMKGVIELKAKLAGL